MIEFEFNELYCYFYPATEDNSKVLFCCHHGAGSSGLSFAPLADCISGGALLAFDARGHGKSHDTRDYSLQALGVDMMDVIHYTVGRYSLQEYDLVLVGHSLGGAVVTRLAHQMKPLGLVVLDVVEGSALEALAMMNTVISKRPKGFKSYDDAIEWHITSKTIRNRKSANITVPPLLIPSIPLDTGYTWRTMLDDTREYWTEWFTGLSQAFLTSPCARLLILAGADRLDKTLMIGQMQGKFQLTLFYNCGHFLHEDDPHKCAEVLMQFWRRNDMSLLKSIKKVQLK